jgi:hypothetical protein
MAAFHPDSILGDPQPRERRTKACVPCHERKVRCDASVTGTLCSRCVSRNRTQYCTLLPPRGSVKASARGREHARRRPDGRRSRMTSPLNSALVWTTRDICKSVLCINSFIFQA